MKKPKLLAFLAAVLLCAAVFAACGKSVAEDGRLNLQFDSGADLAAFSPDDRTSMNYGLWGGKLKLTVNGRGYDNYNYGSCFADFRIDRNLRYLVIDVASLQWEFKVQTRDTNRVLLTTERIGAHKIDLREYEREISEDGLFRLVFFMVGNEYDGNRVLIESIYQTAE